MLIEYDRKVLAEAHRIASRPSALQRHLVKFFEEFFYLAPEARDEIRDLMYSLPRRTSQAKFKRRIDAASYNQFGF